MAIESKIKKSLLRATGRAIEDFGMIEDGDRIMVCLSVARTAIQCLSCCSTCSHDLLDHQLFDFKNLKAATGDIESELDLAVGHTHEDLQPALVSII